MLFQDLMKGFTYILKPLNLVPVLNSSCGKNRQFLTINSDLAVTIRVTGLEKRLGLSIGQSSGTGREVLQEQPGEDDHREILSITVNIRTERSL